MIVLHSKLQMQREKHAFYGNIVIKKNTEPNNSQYFIYFVIIFSMLLRSLR